MTKMTKEQIYRRYIKTYKEYMKIKNEKNSKIVLYDNKFKMRKMEYDYYIDRFVFIVEYCENFVSVKRILESGSTWMGTDTWEWCIYHRHIEDLPKLEHVPKRILRSIKKELEKRNDLRLKLLFVEI